MWVGSSRNHVEAADKKGFGEEGILKADISAFMALFKLRPQRDKHPSVDKQKVLAASGALGSSHGSGPGPCFEGASFQRGRQMCPQTLCPGEALPREVGEGIERAASQNVIWSPFPLLVSLLSFSSLFVCCPKAFSSQE